MKWTLSIIVILIVGFIAFAAWGIISSRVEQARYTVLKEDGQIQIRRYPAMLVAQVTMTGERESAINGGFRKLANFIFGNNKASNQIAMTAPVTQFKQNNGWVIRFVMPAKYTVDNIPKPNQADVALIELQESTFAVITFSGRANDALLQNKREELEHYIKTNQYTTVSEPIYAFFNPPWTLPFLRRNEIMVEIKKSQ